MNPVDSVKVKICGITRIEDADAAVAAGAWALGLNLWPGSRRVVDVAVAAEIAARHRRHAQICGVFVNPTLESVARAADELSLTMIQLHGDEGPSFCAEARRRTGCRVIKAVRVHSREDLQALRPFRNADFHLLDSGAGGSGQTFDWQLARSHRGPVPVILAGGLSPENVADAIEVVGPYAVDVASGVESAPGVKDAELIEAFLVAAHAPSPRGSHATLGPS